MVYIEKDSKEAIAMLNAIIIALWLTMLLGFLLESIKTKAAYAHVQQVNRQLESRLMKLMSGFSDVSVFLVRDLRNVLMEEFVKPHLIDDLELYRVDAHNIHMKYHKERAEQEFHIHVEVDRFVMQEIIEETEDFDEYHV